MRYRMILAVAAFSLCLAAQDRLADGLRKGIVEEESNRNLKAAIQNYESVLKQFDDARQTAATALFRMAECYRKEGNGAQATAAYQRVLREFPDQLKLVTQSREVLAGTYKVKPQGVDPALNRKEAELQRAAAEMEAEQVQQREARGRYRETLEIKIQLVKSELESVQKRVQLGTVSEEDVLRVREKLVAAERDLAAFEAGIGRK
jgi:tetratricopeptide (TPR) repeat protein